MVMSNIHKTNEFLSFLSPSLKVDKHSRYRDIEKHQYTVLKIFFPIPTAEIHER